MSNKTVNIKSEEKDKKKYIVTYVGGVKNGEVKVDKGNTIKFKNELGKEHPVSLYFYKEGDAKIPKNAISDFCKNEASAPYVVEKTANCNMGKSKNNYQYSVEAAGHVTLDPVIIIEDANAQTLPLGILAIFAVALIVFGIMFARWRKSNA